MPCNSMTGFGQAVYEDDELRVKVEIRTVNHRFAETSIRLPRELMGLEDEVRSEVAKSVARGRAEVYISVEPISGAANDVMVDWTLLDALCNLEREANLRYESDAPMSHGLANWLTYPNVIQVVTKSLVPEAVRHRLLDTLSNACKALLEMRMREGERLCDNMEDKVETLEEAVETIRVRAPLVTKNFQARLEARLQEALQSIDENRLLTEIVMLAEKSTIDEEIVRLASHIAEFRRCLEAGSPVGRRLDFIVQEMHREATTIGAKSLDAMMSLAVVDAKVLIEQLREQVQNIE